VSKPVVVPLWLFLLMVVCLVMIADLVQTWMVRLGTMLLRRFPWLRRFA
jgi:hypothetical protein